MFVHSLASFVKRSLVDLIIWLNIWGLIINIEIGFRKCVWVVLLFFFNEKESFLLVFYWFLRWFISPFILLKWIIFFVNDLMSFYGPNIIHWFEMIMGPLHFIFIYYYYICYCSLFFFCPFIWIHFDLSIECQYVVHSGYIGNEMKLKPGKVMSLIPNIHTIKPSE